eukprot:12884201-Prorocentrum_lima.AAC.1
MARQSRAGTQHAAPQKQASRKWPAMGAIALAPLTAARGRGQPTGQATCDPPSSFDGLPLVPGQRLERQPALSLQGQIRGC